MTRFNQVVRFQGVVCAFVSMVMMGCGQKSDTSGHAEREETKTSRMEQAISNAVDAYVYGYPLVTMDMTRRQMTNVAKPDEGHAPMGQFARMRAYPTPEFHTVTAPNADTLYTVAWLDVSKEPWIFSIPDMGDRYYLTPMLDGWTNVFQVPGKRTTGDSAQKYAITGPGWSGALPAGLTEYKSPTALVWIIGRIYCTGAPEDYAKVHAEQNKFSVVPLSSFGEAYEPPRGKVDPTFDMKTAVRDQVDALSVNDYFNYLAKLMKTNPPAAADASMVARMGTIGLVPGQDFDSSKLGAFDREAIKAVPQLAQAKIMEHYKTSGTPINGWMFTTKTGIYGTNYMQRALVTAIGLGANRPEDAVYPVGDKDGDGNDFDGASKKYVMHFDKDQFPPVNGFWSLTMYNAKYFFVPNPLNRYTLSQRNEFVTNPDGSVDLYLQAESPGKGKEANWLPAPKGKFIPMLRLYWPKANPPSIINGTWKPPAIKAVG